MPRECGHTEGLTILMTRESGNIEEPTILRTLDPGHTKKRIILVSEVVFWVSELEIWGCRNVYRVTLVV